MSEEVEIRAGRAQIYADWDAPAGARGAVIFAHGSGSGRHSPRNQAVARALRGARLATLLADLLTADEERVDRWTAEFRFDIPRLARRVAAAAAWVELRAPALPVGLFGASTGAAAAMAAAAERPEVAAVVSRGGRPDLAGASLAAVRAPTLLIVGEADRQVLELNRLAMEQIHAEKRLEIIPGAGHLFEQPGALEQVAALAREWFADHLERAGAVVPAA